MNSEWLDRFGGAASTACALHCLSLATAPALFTLFGMNQGAHGALEWVFFTLTVSFALTAAVVVYRTHHTLLVVLGFATGLGILIAGRMGETFGLFEGGVYFAVAGGGLLLASHLASIRQTRLRRQACCG